MKSGLVKLLLVHSCVPGKYPISYLEVFWVSCLRFARFRICAPPQPTIFSLQLYIHLTFTSYILFNRASFKICLQQNSSVRPTLFPLPISLLLKLSQRVVIFLKGLKNKKIRYLLYMC